MTTEDEEEEDEEEEEADTEDPENLEENRVNLVVEEEAEEDSHVAEVIPEDEVVDHRLPQLRAKPHQLNKNLPAPNPHQQSHIDLQIYFLRRTCEIPIS